MLMYFAKDGLGNEVATFGETIKDSARLIFSADDDERQHSARTLVARLSYNWLP